MRIKVKYLFTRVNEQLARKGHNGYSSADDFNGDLEDSENILYEYYYDIYERTQKIADALKPFIFEKEMPIVNGYVEYPDDFRHPDEMVYPFVKSSPSCDNPTRIEMPMDKLQTNEERDVMMSDIRKPSLEKGLLYWTQVNDKIRVRPIELQGNILFKYFRNNVTGFYATRLDLVKQIDVYDPATSKDLEWETQETTNIIDLMLLHKGLSIRDSDIVNFAIQKMGMSRQNENK